MRKIFTHIHLWLSIPSGILITIICLSGASLVFEKEIQEWQNPSLYFVKQVTEKRLPPSELINRVKSQLPDSLSVSSVRYSGQAERTCEIGFSNLRRKTLFADPYSGEIKGWVDNNQGFFSTMRKLHRWLMDDFKKGSDKPCVGKQLVGISTLLLVIILITGLVVWFPRNRKALRNRLSVKCSKGWSRFWYDTHVSIGFYVSVFLLILALTGLTWSFSWYRSAFYGVFGANKTSQIGAHSHGADKNKESKEEAFAYRSWDRVMDNLENRYIYYGNIRLQMGEASIVANPESEMRQQDICKFHPKTGEIKQIIPYAEQSKQNKLKGWVFALHTGIWGGIWSKILTFVVSFLGGILPLTGYYLWLKKKIRKNKHTKC